MADHTALKSELVALCAKTDAGFDKADPEVERIKALAMSLEEHNPTPDAGRRPDLYAGRWVMLYSSFGVERETTLARLSFSKYPATPVTMHQVFQEIGAGGDVYDNTVTFTGPDGAEGAMVMLGRYEGNPEDGARMDVTFYEVFLAPTNGAAPTDFAAALGLQGGLIQEIAKTPPLHSRITYLDEDLRLNRGSYGNLYVTQRVPGQPPLNRTLRP